MSREEKRSHMRHWLDGLTRRFLSRGPKSEFVKKFNLITSGVVRELNPFNQDSACTDVWPKVLRLTSDGVDFHSSRRLEGLELDKYSQVYHGLSEEYGRVPVWQLAYSMPKRWLDEGDLAVLMLPFEVACISANVENALLLQLADALDVDYLTYTDWQNLSGQDIWDKIMWNKPLLYSSDDWEVAKTRVVVASLWGDHLIKSDFCISRFGIDSKIGPRVFKDEGEYVELTRREGLEPKTELPAWKELTKNHANFYVLEHIPNLDSQISMR